MPRPVDWEVVGQGSDPVPGDPQTIRSLATEYGRIATAAADAATRLRAASGSGWMADWQGAASQVFAEAIKDTPSDLSKLHASYSRASSALSGWAGVVDDTQYRADGALADAKDAAGDLHRAESRLAAAQQTLSHYQTVATGLATTAAQYPGGSAAPSGVSVPTAAQLRAASDNTTVAQSGVDAASGSVAAAQSRIDAATRLVAAAKSDWEDGAQRTAHAIGDAADAGLGKQSFWSSLFHSEIWTELVSVAQVVVAVGSIVAMIVPGPWTLVIAAVALIVVADTLYKMSEGKASGWDLAFALLNCVPAAGAVGEAVRGTEFAGALARAGSFTRDLGAVRVVRSIAATGARLVEDGAGRATYRLGKAADTFALGRSESAQSAYLTLRATLHRIRGGQFTEDGGLLIKRWTPVDRGPLGTDQSGDAALTFRSNTYDEVLSTRPTMRYRSVPSDTPAGREFGSFWAKTPPAGPAATQQELAIMPNWHQVPHSGASSVYTPLPAADHMVQAQFPAGIRTFEGPAGEQSVRSWDPAVDSTLYGNPLNVLPGGYEQVFVPKETWLPWTEHPERVGWTDDAGAFVLPSRSPVVP